MTTVLEIPTLSGNHVRLAPLERGYAAALADAANEDRSSYGFTLVPDDEASMSRYIDDLLAQWRDGEAVPFVQLDATRGRPVGVTRYLTLRWRGGSEVPFAVEIGGTWLAGSAQRSAINTEAKLLLLTHAFDSWRVGRVDFKTDARNARSRTAISRLGATFEGVLRHWQPSYVAGEAGALRDSAMYSVLDDEWPVVRARLEGQLR